MDGDSGIEDVELLESSYDDMDSSGLKRERNGNKYEGFQTGDEIVDAFKAKGKPNKKVDGATEHASSKDVEDHHVYPEKDDDMKSYEEMKSNGGKKYNSSKHRKNKRKFPENIIEMEVKQITNGDDEEDTPRVKKVAKSEDCYTQLKEKVAVNDNRMNGLSSDESVAESDSLTDQINNNTKEQKDLSNGRLKRDPKDQYCSVCEGINGDFIACSGLCLNYFHLKCIGLDKIPTDDFICNKCSTGLHECFVCKKDSGEVKKCSQNSCGKFYHTLCFGSNNFSSSENKIKNKFSCPLHICKYCNENKSLQISNGKRVVKCVKCPLAYHRGSCMPAGCFFLNTNLMICDEHYDPSKTSNVAVINTLWCIICSFGGSLVCCDTCPASFHVECTDDLNGIPEGTWQCGDCRDGNKLRFGDIVWVKFSIYRWWPGRICFPDDVPFRVQNLPHSVGEFPVLFFGSRDYAWLNPRRVFKYAEGDQGGSTKKNYLEKYFLKALEEAKEAFQEMEKKREEHIQAYDKKLSNKPPPYGHIKQNRPVSCVRTVLDRSEWPICQCKGDDPCKNECLNKMLYYECSPSQCPNREHCRNQRIQKYEYAKTKMFKCQEKGWGLKADQEIKFGDFVIEYIGELIDEVTCHKRIQQYHERDIYDYYFLTIDKDNIIDAYPRGNLSRFMNHSCDPNCETQKWTVNGEVRVGLFATRDIALGEELCFNYNLDSLGNEKKKCKCGSANCSGYLGVQPKTQHSISVAEKSKLKEKVNNKRKLKRKRPNKILHEDECFSCGDGGELLCCDRKQCTKAYHQDCLIMEKTPTGKWQCPWHFCDECGKLARSMCSLCPNSFCESHFDGQMVELKDDVLVCPVHDKEEMEKLKDRESSECKDTDGSNSSNPKHVDVTTPKIRKSMKSQIKKDKNNTTSKKSRKSVNTVAIESENTVDLECGGQVSPKVKKSLTGEKKNATVKKSKKIVKASNGNNDSKIDDSSIQNSKEGKKGLKSYNSNSKNISLGKKSIKKQRRKKEDIVKSSKNKNQSTLKKASIEDHLDCSPEVENLAKPVSSLKGKTNVKDEDKKVKEISLKRSGKEENALKPSKRKNIERASRPKLKKVSKLDSKNYDKSNIGSVEKKSTRKTSRK